MNPISGVDINLQLLVEVQEIYLSLSPNRLLCRGRGRHPCPDGAASAQASQAPSAASSPPHLRNRRHKP